MTITVGAYQCTPEAELSARKAQTKDILERADAESVDFLCLPEGFLTGYYEQEELARQNCLEVKGDAFAAWLQVFKGFRSTVIVGFNECEGNHLFNSAAVIENGELLGIQRKHYLYYDYFTPGTTFSPINCKGISIGVVICLDTNYFEPARLLALQGATILFSPMCNRVPILHPYAKRPPYYSQFVARAHENRCWIVSADWIWPNDGEMTCPGHSSIYDPDGREITRSSEGVEQLIIADISSDYIFNKKGRRVYGSTSLFKKIIDLKTIKTDSNL
jgi:predicted amidohydrolase